MLGLIDNKKSSFCSMGFKDTGDLIVLLGINKEEKHACPEIDIQLEKAVQKTCLEAIGLGIIKSAHDCSDGGLSVAMAECTIEGKTGAVISLNDEIDSSALLFDETQSRIILTIDPEQIFVLNDLAMLNKTPFSIIGKVGGKKLIINKGKKKLIEANVSDLVSAFRDSIPNIMRG